VIRTSAACQYRNWVSTANRWTEIHFRLRDMTDTLRRRCGFCIWCVALADRYAQIVPGGEDFYTKEPPATPSHLTASLSLPMSIDEIEQVNPLPCPAACRLPSAARPVRVCFSHLAYLLGARAWLVQNFTHSGA
jgi:hypothetical protein